MKVFRLNCAIIIVTVAYLVGLFLCMIPSDQAFEQSMSPDINQMWQRTKYNCLTNYVLSCFLAFAAIYILARRLKPLVVSRWQMVLCTLFISQSIYPLLPKRFDIINYLNIDQARQLQSFKYGNKLKYHGAGVLGICIAALTGCNSFFKS
jgi:hypothetical protein